MSECKLDHSQADVKMKYQSQQAYLPYDIQLLFERFFESEHSQEQLNEVFHMLKKYDLVSEEEKAERNNRLNLLLNVM